MAQSSCLASVYYSFVAVIDILLFAAMVDYINYLNHTLDSHSRRDVSCIEPITQSSFFLSGPFRSFRR